MTLQYDTPIEVSQRAYALLMNDLSGVCAGRQHQGKFYVKIWIMEYKKEVKQIIEQFPL